MFNIFSQKRPFQSKQEKINILIDFGIPELVQVPNFSLNRQFTASQPNVVQKRRFQSKTSKINITIEFGISLGTKFHPKQTILIFSAKFAQKGPFQSNIAN